MKKFILRIAIVLFIFLVGVSIFLISNYHTTPEGALKELQEKSDGHVIQLTDNTIALVIESNKKVSAAYGSIFYPLGLYKDFKIYPTSLSVGDVEKPDEVAFTNSPKEEGLSFGLIKSTGIDYVVRG